MVLRAGASDSHYMSAKLGGPSMVLGKAGGRKDEEGGLPKQKSLNSSETKTLSPADLSKTRFHSQYKWPAISPQPETYREPSKEPEWISKCRTPMKPDPLETYYIPQPTAAYFPKDSKRQGRPRETFLKYYTFIYSVRGFQCLLWSKDWYLWEKVYLYLTYKLSDTDSYITVFGGSFCMYFLSGHN